MKLFTINLSAKKWHESTGQVTMVSINVFAINQDEAITLAHAILNAPVDFDLDEIVEN